MIIMMMMMMIMIMCGLSDNNSADDFNDGDDVDGKKLGG